MMSQRRTIWVPDPPDLLRDLERWVCWRLEWDGSKAQKVPYNPRRGRRANVTDNRTWSDYETAAKALRRRSEFYVGIGIVLAGLLVGVDLDDCVDKDGKVTPWAQAIVEDFNSYTEYSPSGTGVHILVQGVLQPGNPAAKGRRQGGLRSTRPTAT